MELYYAITFFIFGTILGSFYNVVGYRLPKGESILFPASHCPNCNHQLRPLELIPIFSFFLQGGKCKKCGLKISWFYPIFEFFTGLLFAVSYLIFGMSIEFLIAITFVSMVLIIVISDYQYMIIPDEVLIVSTILLSIEILALKGISGLGLALLNGVIAFTIMFSLKKFGDFLFKKESMGGGDIKLLFVFGLVFGWQMAVMSIFIASFIGLPISLIILYKNKNNIIPFGPFLSAGALMILFTQIDFNWIVNLFR
jgi:leader peptidase (prepilin peptidase)/N-methyltransferase